MTSPDLSIPDMESKQSGASGASKAQAEQESLNGEAGGVNSFWNIILHAAGFERWSRLWRSHFQMCLSRLKLLGRTLIV